MKYRFFIGVDVSKQTLDIALKDELNPALIPHLQVSNDDEGIKRMFDWLNKQTGKQDPSVLFCMEPTGVYCYPLLRQLIEHDLAVWVENAVQIKRSMGIVRGKNDRIDAIRIAEYASKHQEQVRLWQPTREVIDKLKHLSSLRERLVETRKRLITPVEEFRQFGNEQMAKMLLKAMKKSLTAIESDIDQIEKQIKQIIDDDDDLKNLYRLITSVVGIGFVTAVNLIIHTNEFRILNDARKLACYCGVAPFEYSSGKSIRGRTRVNNLANKKLKTNLHMASLTSIRLDSTMKAYYERKVEEGKNKMCVLNAVRNKLVSRVIAVVKRGKPYEKNNYQNNLVMS
jgi:transposase